MIRDHLTPRRAPYRGPGDRRRRRKQPLTTDCIELLRYLHDHRTTRFALVLVGGNGTWRVLSREPILASSIYRRARFQPLSRPDVLAAIPAITRSTATPTRT